MSAQNRFSWRNNININTFWLKKKISLLSLSEVWSAILTFSTLSKISSRQHFEIFFLFFPMETICMKCQNLFSEKNKKNISVSPLLKILPSMQALKGIPDSSFLEEYIQIIFFLFLHKHLFVEK